MVIMCWIYEQLFTPIEIPEAILKYLFFLEHVTSAG